MNILFIDDSHTRNDFFCDKIHGSHGRVNCCAHKLYAITHAYTTAQAIECLDNPPRIPYDIISIDYDLSASNPEGDNGMLIAQHIIKTFSADKKAKVKVFVHSWNSKKKELMVAALCAAGFDCKMSHFYIA
jgi:hypothetical protein